MPTNYCLFYDIQKVYAISDIPINFIGPHIWERIKLSIMKKNQLEFLIKCLITYIHSENFIKIKSLANFWRFFLMSIRCSDFFTKIKGPWRQCS